MTPIFKSDLEHGAAYYGVAGQGIATWDARQQRFLKFNKLGNGMLVVIKMQHVEDADEGFEPTSQIYSEAA